MARTDRIPPYARATTYHVHGDSGSVYYHSTCVVKWDGNSIYLNTGGWMSATTKARLNQSSRQFGLGYFVYQRAHRWYVCFQGREMCWDGAPITLQRNSPANIRKEGE
jgi:hypothetical protein